MSKDAKILFRGLEQIISKKGNAHSANDLLNMISIMKDIANSSINEYNASDTPCTDVEVGKWKKQFEKFYFGYLKDVGKNPLAMQIWYWIESNLLNKVPNPEPSVATGDAQSDEAGNKKDFNEQKENL